MSLKIDLIMFKGEGEACNNLSVWRGEIPTAGQIKALESYLEQFKKGQNHEESEFI